MIWWKQLWCNHSWVLHWLSLVGGTMELKTCAKCGKSEVNKIVRI